MRNLISRYDGTSILRVKNKVCLLVAWVSKYLPRVCEVGNLGGSEISVLISISWFAQMFDYMQIQENDHNILQI